MDKTVSVILIEDSYTDLQLIREACHSLPFKTELLHFEDGATLFQYLQNGTFPHYSFFLIDLKNPVMDGLEVLKGLKEQALPSPGPAIVFSSSTAEGDVRECIAAGANAYVVKPGNYEEFERAVHGIFFFWGFLNVWWIDRKVDYSRNFNSQ